MAFDKAKPMDDEYIAAGPAAIRENLRALKEDQIVDAGTVNGLAVGNASGNIPKANGTLCTNLNAQYLGGNLAGYFSPATHTHSAATTSSNGLMANTDKAKLDGIAAGAQVNQNAFAGILVSGTTIQADAPADTLELVAGSNIALTPDATNDRITIAVTGTVPAAAIAAACTGNAATATTLQTARTIGISGDATGTATSFNGSTNITIPVTLATSGVTAGTYTAVTVDAKGRVTGGTNPTTISANTTGNAATATTATTATTAVTAASCTGNAATATKLATARTIALTGAISGSGSFDGASNLSITTIPGALTPGIGGVQTFTASGTFIVPTSVTKVYVTVVGGGGSLPSSKDYYASGAGDVVYKQLVAGLNPGESVTVTVGGIGGASSFGAYVSASAGSTGIASNSTASVGKGSGGLVGAMYFSSNEIVYSTAGGANMFGIGASISFLGASTAVGYGAGGIRYLNTVKLGTSGLVIVEW
ncbi:hypothetical protein [Anaerospora sp.]|uniref:hypothetical protein n=1 Tax=Anaerospora sp. TaxID=1960278 RepID=UPI0028976CE6|nr:hypothetical protein [Anaerospora sp.]